MNVKELKTGDTLYADWLPPEALDEPGQDLWVLTRQDNGCILLREKTTDALGLDGTPVAVHEVTTRSNPSTWLTMRVSATGSMTFEVVERGTGLSHPRMMLRRTR